MHFKKYLIFYIKYYSYWCTAQSMIVMYVGIFHYFHLKYSKKIYFLSVLIIVIVYCSGVGKLFEVQFENNKKGK